MNTKAIVVWKTSKYDNVYPMCTYFLSA